MYYTLLISDFSYNSKYNSLIPPSTQSMCNKIGSELWILESSILQTKKGNAYEEGK